MLSPERYCPDAAALKPSGIPMTVGKTAALAEPIQDIFVFCIQFFWALVLLGHISGS
jgi:hypothetical protein